MGGLTPVLGSPFELNPESSNWRGGMHFCVVSTAAAAAADCKGVMFLQHLMARVCHGVSTQEVWQCAGHSRSKQISLGLGIYHLHLPLHAKDQQYFVLPVLLTACNSLRCKAVFAMAYHEV